MPPPALQTERSLWRLEKSTPRFAALAGFVTLVLLPFLVYWPAFHGGWVWDDFDYVAHERNQRTLHDLGEIWTNVWATPQYYPLVHTSFWLEYHLWGLNPLGYHLVNVLLHGLTAALAWRVLARLRIPGGAVAGWIAAAIFAVHPFEVESVAWITERKNTLSGALGVAAALVWLRFYGINARSPACTDGASDSRRSKWGWYALGFALFVLALLSKTIAATIPAAVVLLVWWQRRRIDWRAVLPMLPPLVVGFALGRVTAWVEVHRVGAYGQDWQQTFLERCLIAGRALWFYVGKILWPHPLIFSYPKWQVNAGDVLWYAWPLAAIAVAVGLAVAAKRIGWGWLVGALIFAGTVFPALGFVPVYPMRFSYVADHFAYLPSLALIALVVAAVAAIASRSGRAARDGALAFAAVVIVMLGALTTHRCFAYRDDRTIWADTLRQNPRSMIAMFNMIGMAVRAEDYAAGRRWAQAVIDAYPDHPLGYHNMAVVEIKAGNLDTAEGYVRQSIAMYRGLEPERSGSHTQLGEILVEKERFEEAHEQFLLALESWPENPLARRDLADLLMRLDRSAEAIPIYERLVREGMGGAKNRYNLGVAYQQAGRLAEAEEQYVASIRSDPDDPKAYLNLGVVLATTNRPEEALRYFEAAAKRDPENVAAQLNTGMLAAQLGRRDIAGVYLDRAHALQPQDPRPLRAMAALIVTDPRATPELRARAIELAQRVVELTQGRDLGALQLLAAAHGSAGQRDQAIQTLERAAQLAESQGQPSIAQQIRQQIQTLP